MSESEKGFGTIDKHKPKIDSPEIIFGLDADFDEHVGSLAEACNTKNLDAIKDLLGNNKFIENVVIKKGDNKKWLHLLERATNEMTLAEVGKSIGHISDITDLMKVIRSGSLPPFAAAELAGALYHLDRDDECERLAKLISGANDPIVDITSQANAFNTLGSLYMRQGAISASLDANKTGLSKLVNAKNADKNIKWQASKLRYGTLAGRMARKVFADMPDQFFALRREREEMGDVLNLGRTDLDVARAFAALNKKDQAIHYAQRARDLMSETGYWSGANQAKELLVSLKIKN
ncbi:MAG TPA: hypothetical protein VLK22_02195 [Candidatus Udaeobacter sp.]|nr:hypothetical protein [Candidatus Udaeobacter sp.]